jgi:activating signal cointegrator complex subunit 1
MGKKKQAGEYNDFLDGEKLRDNAEVRTSLQAASTRPEISPPPGRQGQRGDKKHGKGGGGQQRPPLTHFLCLPLVTDSSRPQLERGLNKLKGDLESNSLVPTKAVRPLGTLHLTLGVMSLDETRLEDAKRYLQDLDLHILLRDISIQTIAEKAAEDGTIAENLNAAAMPDTDGLTITLAALVPMQSPQKTSILYASPQDSTQRLLPFASALKTHFTEQGFMLDDGRALRLHATIINTIYAKPGGRRGRSAKVSNTLHRTKDKVSPHQLDSRQSGNGNAQASDANREDTRPETGQGHGPDANSWMRFDASELIAKYKDFVWAQDVRIESVQICRMGAKKVWSGGEEGEGEVLDERYEVVCEKGIFE